MNLSRLARPWMIACVVGTLVAGALPAMAQTAAPPAATASQAGAVRAGAVQVKRPNLVVSDIERSLRVYRDILGFKVFAVSDSGPDSYSYPVFKFPTDAKLKMATLSTDSAVRVMALTELKGAAVPPVTTPHRDAVVIEVKGIEDIMTRVKAEGLTIVPPRPSKTPEGGTFIEQAFEDYDGHLIVLYEMRQGGSW